MGMGSQPIHIGGGQSSSTPNRLPWMCVALCPGVHQQCAFTCRHGSYRIRTFWYLLGMVCYGCRLLAFAGDVGAGGDAFQWLECNSNCAARERFRIGSFHPSSFGNWTAFTGSARTLGVHARRRASPHEVIGGERGGSKSLGENSSPSARATSWIGNSAAASEVLSSMHLPNGPRCAPQCGILQFPPPKCATTQVTHPQMPTPWICNHMSAAPWLPIPRSFRHQSSLRQSAIRCSSQREKASLSLSPKKKWVRLSLWPLTEKVILSLSLG